MSVRVGINGFGRIGRNFFRSARGRGEGVEIVAVNDLGDAVTMAHLLKYDSVLGPLGADVKAADGAIVVDGEELKLLNERDPVGAPVGGPRRGRRARVHRPLHEARAGAAAPRRGRAAGRHLGAGDGSGRHARPRGERRRLRPRPAPDRVQRLLHDELRRPAGQGLERRLGDRVRVHDDDPRVHERPADPRLAAQGSAARAGRCDQPHSRRRPAPPRRSASSSRT